ncbi:MAG: hypothetical protein J2P54_26190, partial [Bradyrhizobiaceae bacterium]|nr:hypothetical protein [Bradyrhizobiaceae bacterium]
DGVDVMAHGPTEHTNQVAAFRDGYLWDQLTTEAPNFAAKVAAQDCCLVLTGEIIDPPTLNYFRDVIGSYCRKLVTARIGKVAYRGGALRLHFST